jgi:ribosomal protein S12 methylthiotransferase
MAIKVGMVSLGCPKNQVDAEILLNLIKQDGFELTTDSGLADVVIINTCGFIESAKQESIENILEFCELKKEGRIKCIVVTGCLAERYKDEIAKEIPEADVVLGLGSNTQICEAIKTALGGEKVIQFGAKANLPLSGERIISNLPFFAYLKIAEGCDNCCTYCAIPSIRGRYRSRPKQEILEEAKSLVQNGVKELILVAQDTTKYGIDLYDELYLPKLLDELCEIDGLIWIRILYCYPDGITDELLDVMSRQSKIAKYIDIPLQHVDAGVLQAMNREGDRKSLADLMNKIRNKVDGIVLRTTFIAGFPGETEEQFEELSQFAKDIKFDRLGCFAYSQEEGTPAALMDGQIDEETKQRRAEFIMEQQMFIMNEYNEKKIGSVMKVVVEGYDRYAKVYFGRSEADAPDIDGKIFFSCSRPLSIGEFLDIQIDNVLDYDLFGKAL